MMVDNVIDTLVLLNESAVGLAPPPPRIISLPKPLAKPIVAPSKPAAKKPTAVYKRGSTVELCPSCGSAVKGISTKGGHCPDCGASYKKPIRVDIQTKDPLPTGAFGRATSVMPTGTAIRINKKKYGMPTKEDQVIEQAIDRMVEGSFSTVGHLVLDLAGLVPGWEGFDAANALWYAEEGKYLLSVLSLISVIPIIGDAVGKGGKLAGWLVKALPKAGPKIVKAGPKIAAGIRKAEVAIKANAQVINQILNTAEKDERIGKYVPNMKDALEEFAPGTIT